MRLFPVPAAAKHIEHLISPSPHQILRRCLYLDKALDIKLESFLSKVDFDGFARRLKADSRIVLQGSSTRSFFQFPSFAISSSYSTTSTIAWSCARIIPFSELRIKVENIA